MNKLALIALALWAATAAGLGLLFYEGQTAPGSDGRLAILLAPAERDYVLGEMRQMLIATRDITQGLAAGDRSRAAAAAKAASNHGGRAAPLGLMAKLPIEFKQMGMAMHGGFAELASLIEANQPIEAAYAKLADNLSACVGCHESYRFDPAR